ncbi:MAG: DUF1127 domain-containing protein [Pseudomonadota bacterium]
MTNEPYSSPVMPHADVAMPRVRVGRRFQAVMELIGFWIARARTRRRLDQLPDIVLKDIGVSREDARKEASKPFWM